MVMVRTSCCESYKCCGSFCSVCPHRPENLHAVANTQEALANPSMIQISGRAVWRQSQRDCGSCERATQQLELVCETA